MPRSTTPLSDTEIKKSKIKDNGTKFFRYDYTFQNKRKSMSFGTYPDISLKEARIKRDETKKLLLEGIDPIEYKNNNIPTLSSTFKAIAENWLNKMHSEWKPITHQKLTTSALRLTTSNYPLIII